MERALVVFLEASAAPFERDGPPDAGGMSAEGPQGTVR